MNPASSADEAHIAPRRQRSPDAPSGIIAASATDSICIHATSEAGEPFQSRPRQKSGCTAIQSHGLPPSRSA